MLRRPPAAVRREGLEERVSAKLQAKCRLDVYRVIKQTGPSNYVLGDVATGREVTTIKQPVHADRLVPLEVAELTEPIEEKKELEIEGRRGRLLRQALDGRVLVQLDTFKEEDDLAFALRAAG
eukprot:2626309-Alexandrium_andersonii.AAC.1